MNGPPLCLCVYVVMYGKKEETSYVAGAALAPVSPTMTWL